MLKVCRIGDGYFNPEIHVFMLDNKIQMKNHNSQKANAK